MKTPNRKTPIHHHTTSDVSSDIQGELRRMAGRIMELESGLAGSRPMRTPQSLESETNAAVANLSATLASSNASLPGIAHIVLNYAKSLTGSAIGYVSSLDPVSGDNICHTLTGLMGDSCRISEGDQSIIFPIDGHGRYPALWGHSLNTKKAFYTNNPAEHPAAIGLPDNHFTLKNLLSVPAIFDGRCLGQIALANTEGGFNDAMLLGISRLAVIYALAIERANAARLLREEKTRARSLEQRLQTRPEGPPLDRDHLDEARKALEMLLEQKAKDHQETEDTILRNVQDMILPYLEKLEKTGLSERQRVYVDILKHNLDEIISPFLAKTKAMDIFLTPQEMQVAALIRAGHQTKDIAEVLSISINSVNFHRKNIRSKFKLQNKGINLRAFLLSFTD